MVGYKHPETVCWRDHKSSAYEKKNTACEKGQEVRARMVEGVERNDRSKGWRAYALNNKWLGVGHRE